MRKFALALSLFVPVVCTAQVDQTTPTYEQILNQTFVNLSLSPDVTFTVTGEERTGNQTVPFDTTIVWHRLGAGIDRTQKLSVVKRINGQVVHEIRANGKVLFAYDFKTRSYSATPYHEIRDTQHAEQRDESYVRRMLTSLGRSVSSTGPDSYAARLVTEAMGDAVGQIQVMGAAAPLHYRSWMPGKPLFEATSASPFPDPVIPEWVHTPPPGSVYYLYNGAPRRSIVFQTVTKEDGYEDDELQGITFGESSVVGGRTRLVQWTMAIAKPIISSADLATYEGQFAPYTDMRGWRVVSSAAAPRG